MSNRRERRAILRQMGLLGEVKKVSTESRIEEGKNKQRKHLQNVKNELNKRESTISDPNEGSSDFFQHLNQNAEYGSFKTMLMSRDWESLESKED